MTTVSLSFSIQFQTIPGRSIYVCGSENELGGWQPHFGLPLTWSPNHQWTGSVKISSSKLFLLAYKFIEVSNDFSYIRWEESENRILQLDELESNILLVLAEVWAFPLLTKKLISVTLDSKMNRDFEKLMSQDKDVRKIYLELLADHTMGCMKIDQHYYSSFFTGKPFAASENSRKVKRLTNEIKILQNCLPLDFANAIFIKYDETRMDVMKALIFGAEGTPYSSGAYLFDIYFDENYPLYPPKVTLMTTGCGKIRFNPNLYSNGYVCLSLLGTWSGEAGEKWGEQSNLLQVLISLQSIVMSDGIIYNEPAYAQGRYTKSFLGMDLGYTNIVKYGNIKYAMTEQIKNPPRGFEEIIKYHFYLKKEEILKECKQWLNEAEMIKNDPKISLEYTGLVSSHNYDLAMVLGRERGAYFKILQEEIQILEKTLDSIKI